MGKEGSIKGKRRVIKKRKEWSLVSKRENMGNWSAKGGQNVSKRKRGDH